MAFLFSNAKITLPAWGSKMLGSCCVVFIRRTENWATRNQAFVLLAAWLVNVNLYKAHVVMGQEMTIKR